MMDYKENCGVHVRIRSKVHIRKLRLLLIRPRESSSLEGWTQRQRGFKARTSWGAQVQGPATMVGMQRQLTVHHWDLR